MPQPFAEELKSIQMSPKLNESFDRARVFAREQSHRSVLLEHLLLALTEDPDAAAVMQASNVDPLRLGTDVSGYLGRLLDDMRAPAGTEPQPDGELLRVLHAAGQAAQQSRRRQIDGAIVLAAVVGDGKSPAAGLLKAHGLTFEEAIRALQKATATANAKARSQLYAPKSGATEPPGASTHAPSAPVEAATVPATQPSAPAVPFDDPAQTSQSVDEILAAARARIQQRTAAIVSRPEAKTSEPAPPTSPPLSTPAEQEPLPLSALTSDAAAPAPPQSGSAEGRDADPEEEASSAPLPAASTSQTPPRSSWAPPPAPPVAPRLPPPPPPRAPAGIPNRPLQSGDGPPRPPLPQRVSRPGAPPQPGFPNRPPQPPWPNQPEPGARQGPPTANGALAEVPYPAVRPQRGSPRAGGQGGQGPLVETIPRRMRLGAPAPAQVRISRDKIDGLILLLLGGRAVPHRPDAFVARALTVRLRAPDGGFTIEPESPETQWVEAPPGMHQDEFVGWRWTVTPKKRGRNRLLLIVAARTVGRDGLAAETSPPDRVIEVVVKGGRLRSLLWWSTFPVALLSGIAIDRFGSELWHLSTVLFKRVIGG